MYHEQCPAYPCYCSTLLFGSLHSVGHGVHCPLSSCKNSLREATQCLCPATRSYLQRSALERAVLRNMCSFQLPLPLPPPRLAPFPCCSLRCKDSPLPWRYATRQEHRVRLRPPPPNCPASWRLVQDHRATRLGQSMIGALRRKLNLFSHSLLPTAPTYFPTRPWAASTCPARCSSTSSPP